MRPRRIVRFVVPPLFALVVLVQPSCGGSPPAKSTGDGSERSTARPSTQTRNQYQARVAQATLQAIRERGKGISPKARSRIEEGLEGAAELVDKTARNDAARVAERIALEFGVTIESLMAERKDLGAPWSDIVIAHTFQANTSSGMTARQLLKLHDDGMGWSQIAYGLGLDLGQVVNAVKTECRVATGLTRPDGKVAAIRAEDSIPTSATDVGSS